MADFLLPIDVARVVPSSEYGSRDGATPSMHIWHHGATTSGAGIEANMEPGGRELSATLAIWNNGLIVGKVPERFRPYTSGSYRFDRMAITSEMANLSVDGWTISDATYAAAGRIAAAEYRLYGIPLDRDHHIGHNELYSEKYGWESYPTYCPGPADRVGWIVELGRRSVSSGTAGGGYTPIEEETMAGAFYRNRDDGGSIFYQREPGTPLIPIDGATWAAYAANGNKYADLAGSAIAALRTKVGVAAKPEPTGGTTTVGSIELPPVTFDYEAAAAAYAKAFFDEQARRVAS